MDADAASVARCARVTLLAPNPVPPGALLTMLDEAIAPAGLRLDRQSSVVVVRRIPGAHP